MHTVVDLSSQVSTEEMSVTSSTCLAPAPMRWSTSSRRRTLTYQAAGYSGSIRNRSIQPMAAAIMVRGDSWCGLFYKTVVGFGKSIVLSFEDAIIDEGRCSGCQISVLSDAGAWIWTTKSSAKKLHVANWKHASNKKEPTIVNLLGPAPAWCSETLTIILLMASSTTSK